jgi:tetratricopeptide (TPR) repeat protein
MYPTTVVAGADGKIFAYLAGYVGPADFRGQATKAFDLIAAADKEKDKLSPKPADAVLVSRPQPDDKKISADAPKELLAQAKAAFDGERYAEALERAEAVVTSHPNTPAAAEAATLVTSVKSDPQKLSRAGEQLDDKFAASYYAVAEGWEQKGKVKEATGFFEKVIQVAPGSKLAERARSRLAALTGRDLDGRLLK